ncbi:MAG: hypothetical protein ABIH59_01210 [archaeon]
MNKQILILMLGFLILGTLPIISSVGEINFCCEKTIDGAWCQNAPEEECATGTNTGTGEAFRMVPTSCEATSFCKLGCCYDSQEGTCMENTPEVTCNINGGIYSRDSASCDIPQCALGCCIIGDQAAYVTQTRCKRLSSLYSLETDFRTDINTEFQCIASATSDVKGACVFERDFERTCQLLTQKECKNLQGSSIDEEIEFFQGYLCSAEELGTNCGPTQKTTCLEDKDEVYFVDSCGNLANIYDTSKENSKEYWTKIKLKEESCNPESSNAGSSTCGNCDYYLGSTCKNYDRTKDRVKPNFGNNICRDLACNYEGTTYEHGETWCVTNSRLVNVPGSESFRMVCYNGEVTIEPCAPLRGEICIQEEVNNFKTSACVANAWRDCASQETKKDCENTDKRDCEWKNSGNLKDIEILKEELDLNNAKDFFEEFNNNEIPIEYYQFVCVPKYAPGFNFWGGEDEEETENICSIANTECVARFEKSILDTGKWNCVENCHCCVNDASHEKCTGEDWIENKREICEALGDCGNKVNYIGEKGYNNDEQDLKVN